MEEDNHHDVFMISVVYGEPKHCTKGNPCCCCTLKRTAKAAAITVILISLLKMTLYIAAMVFHEIWYKEWYKDLFLGSTLSTAKQKQRREDEEPTNKFHDKCRSLFIVLAIFTSVRLVVSILVLCKKRPSTVPFLIWIFSEVANFITAIIVIILVQRYSSNLNEEVGLKKVDVLWIVVRLTVALVADLPFVVWFIWIMGANATYLDHQAQAAVLGGTNVEALDGKSKEHHEGSQDWTHASSHASRHRPAGDPKKFQVTAPGYVDTW